MRGKRGGMNADFFKNAGGVQVAGGGGRSEKFMEMQLQKAK